MPNLVVLCHKHKCDKCSTYLEHLLIGAHAGELCAPLDGLKAQQDHAWPTTMNDIRRDVSEPLAAKLNAAGDLCDVRDDEVNHNQWEINDLCNKITEEHCYQ